ncbi:MAG: hypothetical protein PHH77_00370 [Victivallaceae bacterium]|nr:hypothetical protein [Victivallaceae bacterium]
MPELVKLEVYVPLTHAEAVKTALFSAGAGRLGNYDCCCWQSSGTGQFRPLAGSHAFIGELDRVEEVPEIKLELLCPAAAMAAVIAALKRAHPYETPAFQYWPVEIA